MNKLLKIIIPFFIVLGLHADQGVLTSLLQTATGSGNVDVYVDGSDVYSIDSSNIYKYNLTLSSSTSTALGVGTATKVIASSNYVYVISSSTLQVLSRAIASQGTFVSSKTINSVAVSEDESYVFLGTTTGIMVVDRATLSQKAFVETTNAKDLKVKGDLLYVADDWGGLKVLSISNPELVSILSTSSGDYYKLALENDYLYVIGSIGLSSFDISSPSAPILAGNTNFSSNDSSTIFVQDTYAYIGYYNSDSSQFAIYDVSNKANMQQIDSSPYYITASGISGTYGGIYLAESSSTSLYNAVSDYDDNITAASTRLAKSVEQLNSDFGVYGNLQSSSDVDFIKVNLQGGILNANIIGLDDINVSLYDSNYAFLASADSSMSTTPKLLNLTTELLSGTHYIKINNTDGSTTGEYKIVADFNQDDWPDVKSSAELINYGEYIKGNMLKNDDSDYFRVDISSKGGVVVSSENSDVVDFELIDSTNDEVMLYEGDLSTGRTYKTTDKGIYYIKAKAAGVEIEDEDYSFRVDFSQDAVLAKEDDAPFALKSIDTSPYDLSQEVEQINIVGNKLYYVDNSTYTLYTRDTNDIAAGTTASRIVTNTILDYKVIGEYTYVLDSNDNLDILYTNNLNVRNSTNLPDLGSNKLMVNGDKLYISTNGGSQIQVIDISDKDNPSTIANIEISDTVNDFDIKGGFYEDINDENNYGLKTYIYAATDYGIKVFDVTDPTSVIHLTTYKADQSFEKIVISNPYAYVSSGNSFSILYIKKPESTPKYRGLIYFDNGSIRSFKINQDSAYIIREVDINSQIHYVVGIVDISDPTLPNIIDTTYMEAKEFGISNGIGYFLKDSDITPNVYRYIHRYDMSNDYPDVKGASKEIKYNETNYGLISKYRPNDIDTFYINAERTMSLAISAEGNISTVYSLYGFNNDILVPDFGTAGIFNAGISQTDTSVVLKAGEYYLRVQSVDSNTSGSYQFNATKTEDDYADGFLYSDSITTGNTYDANISILDDKDVVKITLEERGRFIFTSSDGIVVTLLYDDTVTTLSDNTNTIDTILNPGTYYVVMESNTTFTGNYQFESTFTPNGELALPNGFDGIESFNASKIIYGDRYIYALESGNNLSVYNHLLQRVDSESSVDSSIDLSGDCGKPFFYDNNLFINRTVLENGVGVCKEYVSISVENISDSFDYRTYGYDEIYYDNLNTASITDRAIVNIDNGYLYEFSKSEGTMYKTLYSDIDYRNEYDMYIYKRAYGYVSGISDINDIKSVKNDENIDIIALNNIVYINKTDPNNEVINTYQVYDEYGNAVYDELGNPVYEDYISYEPILLGSKSFSLSGNIIDMHIDRDSNSVYVLNKNSNDITVLNYNTNDVNLSTSYSVNIGLQASGMFIKDNKVYMTIEDNSYHGVKVYDYPLSSTPVATKEVENIGANLSAPYTWDGSTFNYLSNSSPLVYYLSTTFVDGTTSGTYSVIEANDVKDGDGGFEGCFIATAAYGSYFEAHVKTLREFRDNVLLTNYLGKKIVDMYYKYSPSIASKIAMHSGAKNIIRQLLTPVVYLVKYPLISFGILSFLILLIFTRRYIFKRGAVIS